MFSRFYDPTNDPVVLALNQGTRGESESGSLFTRGDVIEVTMEKLCSALMEEDPENQVAMLFYLLASMELDRQEDVLEKVWYLQYNQNHPAGPVHHLVHQPLHLHKIGSIWKKLRCSSALDPSNPDPIRTDARTIAKDVVKIILNLGGISDLVYAFFPVLQTT